MEYTYPRPDKPMSAGQLSDEIKGSLGYDTRIRISPSEVWIQLDVTLTDVEETSLATLVADHVTAPPSPTPLEILLTSLGSYGVHSYTPAQVDAFIDSVSTVAELRALLKTMAKCIIAYAEYFEAGG